MEKLTYPESTVVPNNIITTCGYLKLNAVPEYGQGDTPRKWIGKLISQVDQAKKDAILAKGDNGMVKKTISKTTQKRVVPRTYFCICTNGQCSTTHGSPTRSQKRPFVLSKVWWPIVKGERGVHKDLCRVGSPAIQGANSWGWLLIDLWMWKTMLRIITTVFLYAGTIKELRSSWIFPCKITQATLVLRCKFYIVIPQMIQPIFSTWMSPKKTVDVFSSRMCCSFHHLLHQWSSIDFDICRTTCEETWWTCGD